MANLPRGTANGQILEWNAPAGTWVTVVPAGAGATLQTAYDNGNTMVLSAVSGDLLVSGTEEAQITPDGNLTLVSNSAFTTLNGDTGIGLTSANGNINLASTLGFATVEGDQVATLRSNSDDADVTGQVDVDVIANTGNLSAVSLAGFTTLNGDTGIGLTSANGNINIASTLGFATVEGDNVTTLRSNNSLAAVTGQVGLNLIAVTSNALLTSAAGFLTLAGNTGVGLSSAAGNVNVTSSTGFGTVESQNDATLRSTANDVRIESFSTGDVEIGISTDPDILSIDSVTSASVAVGRVLSWNGTQNEYIDPAAGGSGKIHMWASLTGNASGTIGQLQIFNVSTSNPGGVLEQTSSGDPGINNGGSNPILMPACTLVKATLTKAHTAVSQATTGGSMTARFELFEAAYSTRASLANLDFPVTSAGVFNNLGGNNFEKGITLSPSVAITEGAPLGLQFTNRSANNNEINGIGGCYVYLEFDLP